MNEHVCCPGCEPDAHIAHPSTPRVAESLDDLRVGMVVANLAGPDSDLYKIDHINFEYAVARSVTSTKPNALLRKNYAGVWDGSTVILVDPPPEPVRVPADLIDALAEALEYKGIWSVSPSQHPAYCGVLDAAKALVDAARNGTDQ